MKLTYTLRVAVIIIASLYSLRSSAQVLTEDIRLNQIGYYPDEQKLAIVVDNATTQRSFYIKSRGLDTTYYTGNLAAPNYWDKSEEDVRQANFSDFTKSGVYVIHVPEIGFSYPFEIRKNIHLEILRSTLKTFYYQRASTPLLEEHAGKWSRAEGHPDTMVYVHPSAASVERPTNTIISAPKGWYDAGDYNKYVNNASYSTSILLSLYEHYPAFFRNLNTNIPESKNALPDLLDEALWNLKWLYAMQDPNDGGVYHKLTEANFSGYLMPEYATAKRYVIQKSRTAGLTFAAVMAQVARIYSQFPETKPFADSCGKAAIEAWKWVLKNPNTKYDQNAMNRKYSPKINTGDYTEYSDVIGEYCFAALELYTTFKADSFYTQSNVFSNVFSIPGWDDPQTLSLYTILHHRNNLTTIADTTTIKEIVVSLADDLLTAQANSPYSISMVTNNDLTWGGNGVSAVQGMTLLQAYQLTKDKKYLDGAVSCLDYLLGRNATAYCFVTGDGNKSPMFIHHRPSEADGIEEPIPGFLPGGPGMTPGVNDQCPGWTPLPRAKSYYDNVCSYSTNEVAINYEAPLVYLAGAIEAIKAGNDTLNLNTIIKIDDMEGIYTSTNDLELEKYISVYPNPSDGNFTLQLPSIKNTSIKITNLAGQEITNIENPMLADGKHSIDISNYPNGMYIIQLHLGNNVYTKQLVKINNTIK